MIKFVNVKEAADILGVTTRTIRRWEKEGRLIPTSRTKSGQCRYDIHQLQSKNSLASRTQKTTFAYARTSSYDKKRIKNV